MLPRPSLDTFRFQQQLHARTPTTQQNPTMFLSFQLPCSCPTGRDRGDPFYPFYKCFILPKAQPKGFYSITFDAFVPTGRDRGDQDPPLAQRPLSHPALAPGPSSTIPVPTRLDFHVFALALRSVNKVSRGPATGLRERPTQHHRDAVCEGPRGRRAPGIALVLRLLCLLFTFRWEVETGVREVARRFDRNCPVKNPVGRYFNIPPSQTPILIIASYNTAPSLREAFTTQLRTDKVCIFRPRGVHLFSKILQNVLRVARCFL